MSKLTEGYRSGPRIPTSLYRRIEAYADKNGLSKAQSVVDLIRLGLNHEQPATTKEKR